LALASWNWKPPETHPASAITLMAAPRRSNAIAEYEVMILPLSMQRA
jgi:hypothetical protein